MTLVRGFTDDIKLLVENANLGASANELFSVTLNRIGMTATTPLSLYASFPTANALLNIGSSLVEAGDGSAKSVPPISSVVPTPTLLTSINFQNGTIVGQAVTVNGAAFALPAGTVGRYRRWVAVLRSDGSIDSTFSTESVTVSGLTNVGTLLFSLLNSPGLPIGWVDLQCTNVLGSYKTANSATPIIENKVGSDHTVFRFSSSGGDVQALLNAEITARMNADSSLQANLNIETTAREVADSSLYSALGVEVTARKVADSSLQANLDIETTARKVADSSLYAALAVEATARQVADSSLQANLDIETTARKVSDSSLQANINSEITSRTVSDSSLQMALEVEITARTVSDSSLQANLDIETTARKVSDSSLQANLEVETTARKVADSSLYAVLDIETTARKVSDSSLQINLDIETTARTVSDSSLYAALDIEVTARKVADSSLQANLDVETTARKVADSSLQANLNIEVTARDVADSSLYAAIDVETSARKVADSSLSAALDVEVTARKVADSSLYAALDVESTARKVSDSSLQANLNIEVTAREVADSSLYASIDVESTARKVADSSLSAAIDVEVTAREVADSSLYATIDVEVTARKVVDSSLYAAVDIEVTARKVADSSLSAALDVEVSARKVADSSLYASLDVEVTARKVVDSSLYAAIDVEVSARKVADSSLYSVVDTEVSARKVADSSLYAAIDVEVSARKSADSTINSVGIGNGNGTTGSGTIGGGNLKVDLGTLTSTWDATAYNISVKTPTTAAHATTKEYVDQLALTGGTIREALLTDYQLKNGASGGILGAEVVYFNTNPGINDTIILKNASVTETFIFKAARSGAFEVTIGTLPADTMSNLVAAMALDSTAWLGHFAIDGLDAINTIGVVVIINLSTTTTTSRIYGTWATQANCKVVEFFDSYPYEYRTSKVAISLPLADPAAERFGYREAIGTLTDGEIHLCLETDSLMSWHVDTLSWLTLSGSGSLPDATAGAGGGTKGKVTLDSDRGLDAASGLVFVKIDNSTIKFRSSLDSNLNGQLIVDPGLLNAEITARTNADSSLQANINGEYSSRITADSSLQGNINIEYSARVVADSSLQANLNIEVTARDVADSSLQVTIASLDVTAFAFSSISGENLTINKGYMILAGDGREIYSTSNITYNLSGLAANGDYYGYLDLISLGTATTVNGRKVIAVTDANFYFSTTTPDAINLEQYYPQGLVRRIAGSWVTPPVTLAFKRHATGGSGGDSSFRISSVAADGTILVKGGYIALNYDAIMATYDGAGTTEADFGKDLTFDLDSLVSPVNDTTYYLYVDIYSLPAEVTLTDSGRQLIPVTSSNFVLLTQDFESVYQFRYAKIGVVRRNTGVWSTTVAISYPQKKQIYPSALVSPMVFSLEQTIGNVGDASQINSGHILAASSFPSSQYATKVSFYNLNGLTDGNTALAHNLLNNGSTPFTGTGILGVASTCASLNGTTQWLKSADVHFNPGAVDWVMGGWFKPTSYTPVSNQTLFSSWAGGGNQKFTLELTTQGNLLISSSTTGSNSSSTTVAWGTGSGWNHIALRYDVADQDLYLYVNSVLMGIHPVGAALYVPASPDFCIGARSGGSVFFSGLVDEFFAVNNYGLSDSEIAKIYAAKVSHSNSPLTSKCQNWQATITYSGLVVQIDEDFVVAMDDNDLYVDLSGQMPTATVYLTLQNNSLSGGYTSVSVSRMFEATAAQIDSWGTFSHKLPNVPTVMAMLVDVGSGYYEHHDASAYFKASTTQLAPVGGSDLTTILGGSTNVKLLVSVGPAAIYSPPDVTIVASINAEITARIVADSSLQASVNSEATARTVSDSSLQANINSEITSRIVADSSLQASVNSEVTSRIVADSSLQANINAEITARMNADWEAIARSSAFAPSANDRNLVDTSGGAITATLPSAPTIGDEIEFVDARGTFGTSALTLDRNGKLIHGSASNYDCDVSSKRFKAIFVDNTYGWAVTY